MSTPIFNLTFGPFFGLQLHNGTSNIWQTIHFWNPHDQMNNDMVSTRFTSVDYLGPMYMAAILKFKMAAMMHSQNGKCIL